jgi:hypothetical protein
MRALVALALVLVLGTPGWAARNTAADQPVTLKVELAKPTALAFPETVASVIVGFTPEQGSIDIDGSYAFFLLNDPGLSGRFFILGQSGKLYHFTFKVASPADDVVHLTTGPVVTTTRAQPFSVASFLRALRSGTPLPGQEPSDLPPPTTNDVRLVLTDNRTVALGRTVGMVLAVRNTGPAPVALDMRLGEPGEPGDAAAQLTRWAWPPRATVKAIAAEEELLTPGGQTRLYLVFERRP